MSVEEKLPFLNNVREYNRLEAFNGRKKFVNYMLGSVDIAFSILSFALAIILCHYFIDPLQDFSGDSISLIILMVPTWIILLKSTNISLIPRTSRYLTIFFYFARFWIVGMIFLLTYKYIFGLRHISFITILVFSVLNFVMLYTLRILTFRFFKYSRANGHNIHNVIVIADAFSEEFIQKILDEKAWGFRIIMIVSDSKLIRAKFGSMIKIIPERANIRSLIEFDIIDEVIYSKLRINYERIQALIAACEEIGVIFRMQSNLSPMSTKNTQLDLHYYGDEPFLTFMDKPSNYFIFTGKSMIDIIFSAIILLLLTPVFLLVSIAIKLDSKGPVFFRQERVGLRGRKFYMYKFRTMVAEAEKLKSSIASKNEADGPVFKIKNDPRITPLGRILRKSGVDELPQLYNVMKGEMSLIGPRPPIFEEVKKYKRWQLRRLSVKPGITCTWQIIPHRNKVLFDNWVKLDLQYIDSWSFKQDMVLLFKTIKTVFNGSGV